jgi:hypothetical protein
MRATAFSRSRTGIALLAVGLIYGLVLLGRGSAGPAGAASAASVPMAAAPAAATCVSADPLAPAPSRGDFDGDSHPDIVVGMPGYAHGAGAVDVRGTNSPAVLLRAVDLGVRTHSKVQRFGGAIAIGDLDGDGCSELVIGADAEEPSDGTGGNEGQVHIVFGTRGAITTTGAITLPHDSADGDRFGHALALTTRWEASGKVHDLYVGAPGAMVGGKKQAGEVFRYTIAPSSSTRITATLREVRSQSSAGVPGGSETGDGFGSVLAAVDNFGNGYNPPDPDEAKGGTGVLVGAPNKDVGSKQDAGAIWYLRVDAAGAVMTSQNWSQNTAGVPGKAETKDHFGSALSVRNQWAVVGTPDENEGSKVDSGVLHLFKRNFSTGRFAPGKALTQDSAGVPGTLRAGNRFGAAVAVGEAVNCQEETDLAAGAPGEDIGSHQDAGSITLITLTSPDRRRCPSRSLHQGSGLVGAAETGDEVGSVLGVNRGPIDLDEDYSDALLIGVPKENVGAVVDAGQVQSKYHTINANGVLDTTVKFSKGYRLAHNLYGMVLSSSTD